MPTRPVVVAVMGLVGALGLAASRSVAGVVFCQQGKRVVVRVDACKKKEKLVTLLVINYKASQEIPAHLSEFYDSLFKLLLQRLQRRLQLRAQVSQLLAMSCSQAANQRRAGPSQLDMNLSSIRDAALSGHKISPGQFIG